MAIEGRLDVHTGAYKSFVSGSMSIEVARPFALGDGGAVLEKKKGGVVFELGIVSLVLWRLQIIMRWISKFPGDGVAHGTPRCNVCELQPRQCTRGGDC